MASGQDESVDATTVVREVFADPAAETGRLPQLLGLLDAAGAETRIVAGSGIKLVVDADPDMVEPVTHRLVDRLEGDADNAETMHVLAYLRHRYPDRVRETLEAIAEEARERENDRRREISTGFAQRDPYGGPTLDRGVGRTQFAAERSIDDPRSVFKEEGEKVGGAPAEAREDRRDEETDDIAISDGEIPEHEKRDNAEEIAERTERRQKLRAAEYEIGLETILQESRFEDLAIVDEGDEGRYTDVYRTRAVQGDTVEGIALHTFRPPEDDENAFVDDVCEALLNWQAVTDHGFVTTLYDWGRNPQLWMATEYTSDTLYDRIGLDLVEAMWNGLVVARTVAYAHQRGVIHSGMDPYNVVYSGNTIKGRQKPMVTNVGLLDVLRMYGDPSEYLDPRYAAPEYFDSKYGQVDHATDIYQLGSVLYHLATGRPPFDGDYGEVRTAALEATPPAPSELNPEIPEWFDGVIRKAMAKQKLTRYESANQLAQEIQSQVGDIDP